MSCASFFGTAQAGPRQLPAGTLDLCPCVGSAQYVAVELHPLQWEALSHFLSEWLLVEFSLCLLLFLLVVYFPPELAHHRTIPAPYPSKCLGLAEG